MTQFIRLSDEASGRTWEVQVLLVDLDVLVLSKPAGLPVSPETEPAEAFTLVSLLHKGIAEGKSWAKKQNVSFLAPCHRIDLEATGVIVFGRSKEAFQKLADQFGTEKPMRKYLALCNGVPDVDRLELNAKVGPHPVRPGVMTAGSTGGKRSSTVVEVLERFEHNSLLRCVALTDRPHQVRVHLRYAQLPLCGDTAYRGRPLLLSRLKPGYRLKPGKTERPLISTPALHLETIEFVHPGSDEITTVTAPLPRDFQVALKYLRRTFAGPQPEIDLKPDDTESESH